MQNNYLELFNNFLSSQLLIAPMSRSESEILVMRAFMYGLEVGENLEKERHSKSNE